MTTRATIAFLQLSPYWKAINHYDLSGAGIVLAGDFNSNAIWDRKRRVGRQSFKRREIPGGNRNFQCLSFTPQPGTRQGGSSYTLHVQAPE